MSNGSAPSASGFWPTGTNRNSAAGSTNRRLSRSGRPRRPARSPTSSSASPGAGQRRAHPLAELAPEVVLGHDLLVAPGEGAQVGALPAQVGQDVAVGPRDPGRELLHQRLL